MITLTVQEVLALENTSYESIIAELERENIVLVTCPTCNEYFAPESTTRCILCGKEYVTK